MDTNLAAREDAATILKLYELRTDPVMREARHWITTKFWPQSAEEIVALIGDFGSQENCWFRQVTTYWEMAAALVNHGILAPALFCDTNGEPFFLLAKFWPFLAQVRQQSPSFMKQMESLTEQSTQARQKLEGMLPTMEKRRAAAARR